MCAEFLGGNLKGRNNSLDLHADGSITQKWVSHKLVGQRGQPPSGSG